MWGFRRLNPKHPEGVDLEVKGWGFRVLGLFVYLHQCQNWSGLPADGSTLSNEDLRRIVKVEGLGFRVCMRHCLRTQSGSPVSSGDPLRLLPKDSDASPQGCTLKVPLYMLLIWPLYSLRGF